MESTVNMSGAAAMPEYRETPAASDTPGHRLFRDTYEPGVTPARLRMRAAAESTVLAAGIDPLVLNLFLIHYSIQGVGMTEPVESWVDRAGRRCEEIGLSKLGRSLRLHAKAEANHHLMFIEDTRALAGRWDARGLTALNWDRLRAQPMSGGVERYRALHEDVIASDSPFSELAIECEIERLSVDLGPRFLDHCQRVLGPTILGGLSFLKEHVELDVGHTNFNEEQIAMFFDLRPESISTMLAAGGEALDAYAEFVRDCYRLAVADAEII